MPPVSTTTSTILLLLLLLLLTTALLPLLALAQTTTTDPTPAPGSCPSDIAIVHSPFQPYFKFPTFRGNAQLCWNAADCLFKTADESRKQQFAATALVMGLIPLTLKDIAWPERRLVPVTQRLPWAVEILVLALGLVPQETRERAATRRKLRDRVWLAQHAWTRSKTRVAGSIVVCSVAVLASYAGLVFMEVYSKRSALGCPAPFTIAAWYVVALLPAALHSLFAALRRRRDGGGGKRGKERMQPGWPEYEGPLVAERPKPHARMEVLEEEDEGGERKGKIISAVQGADEDWPVQMAWAIYYIAGTLVFTSIMAVTVPELAVWVGLGFTVTGSSKVLAFLLCLVCEHFA